MISEIRRLTEIKKCSSRKQTHTESSCSSSTHYKQKKTTSNMSHPRANNAALDGTESDTTEDEAECLDETCRLNAIWSSPQRSNLKRKTLKLSPCCGSAYSDEACPDSEQGSEPLSLVEEGQETASVHLSPKSTKADISLSPTQILIVVSPTTSLKEVQETVQKNILEQEIIEMVRKERRSINSESEDTGTIQEVLELKLVFPVSRLLN